MLGAGISWQTDLSAKESTCTCIGCPRGIVTATLLDLSFTEFADVWDQSKAELPNLTHRALEPFNLMLPGEGNDSPVSVTKQGPKLELKIRAMAFHLGHRPGPWNVCFLIISALNKESPSPFSPLIHTSTHLDLWPHLRSGSYLARFSMPFLSTSQSLQPGRQPFLGNRNSQLK